MASTLNEAEVSVTESRVVESPMEQNEVGKTIVQETLEAITDTPWNKGEENLSLAIAEVTKNVLVWKNEVFGSIFKKKRILVARIRGIQQSPDYGHSAFLQELEFCLQQEYHEVLRQEETKKFDYQLESGW
ncbi:hypothetical protein COLO4_18036 [Corchorus olitorius]|uniref:Uncharacterized protein n=1 Tax=Corchorus olitorius TaxID=93759 RepID=A0A1R3JAP3_9ROSI|nr:hypothetical protein COLO4_18036 [Corchorus olitorius]